MKSSLSIRRTFIPFGYSSEYGASCDLQALQLPDLAASILSNLFEPSLFSGSAIDDLKGRDPEVLIDSSISARLKPQGFELIFISGKRFTIMGDDPQTALVQPDQNFTLSVLTPFDSFEGSRHIRHKIETVRVELPGWMLPIEAVRAFPLEIDCFRIGLDLFEPKFGSILGVTPTVTETLLIEADQQVCKLKISADMKNRGQLPLTKNQRLEKLDRVFNKIFSVSLLEDYQAKLKS
jgi:hypothetical protein